MVWLIFAVIVGVAGLVALVIRRIEDGSSTINLVPWSIGLLVAASLMGVASMVRSVGPGEIGVQVLLGKVQSEVLESGVHFVNPLMGVTKQTVRSQTYTVGNEVDEDKTDFQDGPILVKSSDGANLPLEATFRFRLDSSKAGEVFVTIGTAYFDKVVRPAIRTVARDEAAKLTVVDIYSLQREAYSASVQTNLESVLAASGIILESTLIRDIGLPKTIGEAIEAKLAAEQEAEQQQFVLEKITAQAEQKREEAKGIRDAQDIISGTLSPAYIEFLKVQALQEIARGQNNLVFFTDSSTGLNSQPPVQTVLDLSGLLTNGTVVGNGAVAEGTSVTVGSEDGS